MWPPKKQKYVDNELWKLKFKTCMFLDTNGWNVRVRLVLRKESGEIERKMVNMKVEEMIGK